MPDPARRPDHPHQVRLEVHMTTGVTNSLICTLHGGDYSYVQGVSIDGISVAYVELPDDVVRRRMNCVTQEVGHKVPASTIRKVDGRLVGSCEKCHERFNIAAVPGGDTAIEIATEVRNALFRTDNGAAPEAVLTHLAQLDKRLARERAALDKAAQDLHVARTLALRRLTEGNQ